MNSWGDQIMDYAVILLFDDETEYKLGNLIKYLACNKTNNYMIDNKILPHITLSLFSASETTAIKHILETNAQKIPKCSITWASIGAFVPNVLFSAPVINKQITIANEMADRFLKPVVDSFNLFYQPNNWVPHTTLATNLTSSELLYAFEIAVQKFTPLNGFANRVALVECNPYKEICVWQL